MRQHGDWIEAFEDHVSHLPSPDIFRRWGGIAAVAGALERKVWVRTIGIDLFPNIYTVLVGPPGVGKTVVTSQVEDLWRSLPEHHVAPKSLTAASIVDSLADAKRAKTVIGTPSIHLEFHSLLINSGELGVLLPQYDNQFMNMLTDLYDCRQYEERRRGKDIHITLPRPQINILAACTPSYLNSMLPEGAWDQGFLSRTFLVYSGERVLSDIFATETSGKETFSPLALDLKEISNMMGKFEFTEEAMVYIRDWHLSGGDPIPDHPKLTHYNTRRTMHLIKLSMIASASESSDLSITLQQCQRAMAWLLQMEVAMPDIFKALGSKGDAAVIDEAYHFLYQTYMSKNQKPVLESRLIAFLSERLPSHSVMRVLELMQRSGYIKQELIGSAIGYRPLGRHAQ